VANKTDIKRLLSKGLTGLEAAKLILQDSWEVDHHREGFLSSSDIQRIKTSLRTQQDIEDYNKWIRVYQLLDYTLKDAHIHALEAEATLQIASRELERYHLEHRIRAILGFGLPAIVTEKQYQELKAKQRASLLAKKKSLYGLACSIQDEEEDTFPSQALQELLPMMRDGRIRPVLLPEEAIQQLKDLEAEAQAHRDQAKEHPDMQDENFWRDHSRREEQILEEAYPKARPILPEELDVLEPPLPEDPTEEQDRLFYYLYFSSQDLYDAGLLRDWIDEYVPDLDEETSARPAGMMQARSVAIIQDPSSFDLDERGYYKDAGAEMLSKLSGYERRQKLNRDFTIPEFLEVTHHKASELIKIFLAIQAVTEAVSEIIGVKLTEDLEEWYSKLETTIDLYNAMLTPRSELVGLPHYLGMPKLNRLKVGRLKPTAKSIRYYRERMAIALGDEWWREALNSIEFQEAESESLAEEMIHDIEAVREQASKEAHDGQE